MKKAIFLAFLAFCYAGGLYCGTITVAQPGGGDVTMGAALPIAWTASGVSGNFKIQLIRPGGALVSLLLNNIAASPQSWTVAAPAVAGESYKVRVRAMDGSAEGESAIFTVVDTPPVSGLTLQSPNGGESWKLGSIHPITWTATDSHLDCRLVLLKDDQFMGIIRPGFTISQGGGSWSWKVGEYYDAVLVGPARTAPVGSGYKVRMEVQSIIVDPASDPLRDQSDNPFAIAPADLVFVTTVKAEMKSAPLRPPSPDMVICLAWGGHIPNIYQDKRVNVRIKNVGPGNAPAGSFKIYVEGHGDQIVPVPALAPKGEFYWSKKYDWKTCGHKTVRVTADADGLIAESNENNNMLQGSIKVSCSLDNTPGYLLQVDRCSDQN